MKTLLGDPINAQTKLGWIPKTTLRHLVTEVVKSDYEAAKIDALVKMAGFQAYNHRE